MGHLETVNDTSDDEGDAFAAAKVGVRSAFRKKSKKIRRLSLRKKKQDHERPASGSFTQQLSGEVPKRNLSKSQDTLKAKSKHHDLSVEKKSTSYSRVPTKPKEEEVDVQDIDAETIKVKKICRKPKEKKNQAKTQTEQIEPVVLTSKAVKIEEPVDDKAKDKPIGSRWQEKVINSHAKRLCRSQKEKNFSAIERNLSLKNIHNLQKKRIMESLLPRKRNVNGGNIVNNKKHHRAQRTVSTHKNISILQPDTTKLSSLLDKVNELMELSNEIEKELADVTQEFHMDTAICT